MRYFVFALALLLVSASSIRVRDVLRIDNDGTGSTATEGSGSAGGSDDSTAAAGGSGSTAAAGGSGSIAAPSAGSGSGSVGSASGSDGDAAAASGGEGSEGEGGPPGGGEEAPAASDPGSGSGDAGGHGSGGAFDKAVDSLGLNSNEVTQGVKKNIAAQINEADMKNKANMMVKMAEENSKKLVTATMEGLIKTPPQYKHTGKWILPSESPVGDLVVIPQTIDRGAIARRQVQKKFDDVLLGRTKSSGGFLLDPRMSTSNAALYLAQLQSDRSDETHKEAEAALAANCGDPLIPSLDCSKVTADVPYSEEGRTLDEVMKTPVYNAETLKEMRRKYNAGRSAERGGPPIVQKTFTAIRNKVSDLHTDIDEIGVELRKQLQHDKNVEEREAGDKKLEEKKKLINQAKEESTKVLDDEEVAALKTMKPE